MAPQDSRQQGRMLGGCHRSVRTRAEPSRYVAEPAPAPSRLAAQARLELVHGRSGRARAEPSRYIAEPAPPPSALAAQARRELMQCRLKAQAPGVSDDRCLAALRDTNWNLSAAAHALKSKKRPGVAAAPPMATLAATPFTDPRTAEMTAFNQQLEPSLAGPDSTGVCALRVSERAAQQCAEHLQRHWRDGRLPLRGGDKCCRGYSQYGKVLERHDSEEQRTHTLLLTNAMLPLVRAEVAGFQQMEDELVTWLHERYGTVVELFFAHALRQGPHTLRSTGFDIHQDTEEFPFITFTVVVKITADAPAAPRSQMRVVGAAAPFDYDATAGAAGCFRAALHHASVAPRPGAGENLKVAFFFRASEKGERRAKRGLSEAGSDLEVAQRRRTVVSELNGFGFEAGRTLPI